MRGTKRKPQKRKAGKEREKQGEYWGWGGGEETKAEGKEVEAKKGSSFRETWALNKGATYSMSNQCATFGKILAYVGDSTLYTSVQILASAQTADFKMPIWATVMVVT